jgi:D-glycero-beta-D-manno-heptose-7-phosphate kinase
MTTNGRLSFLSSFPGKRILIVGDVMLDEYVWGNVQRISPEAPVPIVEVSSRSCVPGGAGNTAANVAGLGGHALLGGTIGCDQSGRELVESLKRVGVVGSGLLEDMSPQPRQRRES